MKKKLLSAAIILFASLMFLLFPPLFASAQRLDRHSGMMKQNSANLMAYQNSNLTGQLNHYICAMDWYDLTQNCSNGNAQLHYPITVANGKGSTTETHYFNGNNFRANSDGDAGTFDIGFIQTKWYRVIPRNGITYRDNWNDNGTEVFVSNNIGFHIQNGAYNNNQLWCGNSVVMKADTIASYCYYNHSDYNNADWHWARKQQQWGTSGLIQGKNTVYFAGTDASANYTTGQATFYYDTIAPTGQSTEIKNVTAAGYDAYVYGVTDPGADKGTGSGVDHVKFPTWTKADQLDLKWLDGKSQGSGTWMCHISSSDFGGVSTGYKTHVYMYDKAGNYSGIKTDTKDVIPQPDPTDPEITPVTRIPVADFEVESPVPTNTMVTYNDKSHALDSWDSIDNEEWSWSTDGLHWSEPSNRGRWSYDLSEFPSSILHATYYVRLRVHNKGDDSVIGTWSEYCQRPLVVYRPNTKPTAVCHAVGRHKQPL